MRRKGIRIFYFQINNRGSILFPVLAILFMFTFLLLFVTQDYFSRRELLVNTKDFYMAKTMEELSFIRMDSEKIGEQIFYFNSGSTLWTQENNQSGFLVETSLSNQYKRTSNRWVSEKR